MKPKAKNIWQEFVSLSRLWPFLKPQWPIVAFSAAFVPLIAWIETTIPLTISRVIDEGMSDFDRLGQLSLFLLGLFAAQYVCKSTHALSAAYAVHSMVKKLRTHLMRHILRLSCSFHDRSVSGTLVTRATSDFDNLSESLNSGILSTVIDFAVLFGSIIGLLYLDVQLTLWLSLLIPVVGFTVSFFSRKLKDSMLVARKKIAEGNAFSQECLYGHMAIKVLNAQKDVERKYAYHNLDYRDAQMTSVRFDAILFAVVDGISSITIGIIFFFIANQWIEGLTAGVAIAFAQYTLQLFEPIKQVASKIAMLQGAFTSMERIFGLLDQKEFIDGDEPVSCVQGGVTFENVSFSYGKETILKNLSFQIEAHTSLAIVGSTGSGKSTIIKLLSKLYQGYEGSIFLDGRNIASIHEDAVRSFIAVVPQDIQLFEGSLEFNVGLGRCSQEEVWQALKDVGAEEFCRSLGDEFIIKEGGENLSHGQRQLLVFARAIATRPSILILDEATSSVDPESERLIQEGMKRILKNQTVIIIAHRLNTIKACDQIIMLEKGQKVESGNFADLMEKRGQFYELYGKS